MPASSAALNPVAAAGGKPIDFDALPGFADDDFGEAWRAFLASCAAAREGIAALRPAIGADAALRHVQQEALKLGPTTAVRARDFIRSRFQAWRIDPGSDRRRGFLTGYYEPVVAGSWTKTAAFSEPLKAPPADLAARLAPRRDIDLRGSDIALLHVRDAIEAFMIMVQGSATIDIHGERVPLTYAGRNGRPYTSIGAALIKRGAIAPADMSLDRLKQWVRAAGQEFGQAGRDLLWLNESYVFFDIDRSPARAIGPIGGAGVPLSPLRSIATDRSMWPYGSLFWIDAALPWRSADVEPFRRLMVSQDTGSAILGPARADIYFGAGAEAGARAGGIRHDADLYALSPADRA